MKKTDWVKLIAALLVIAVIVPLASCASDVTNTPIESTEDTTDVVTDIPEPEELDLSEYVIVRSEKATKANIKAIADFSHALNDKLEMKIALGDDFVKEGTVFVEAEKEILIGQTNREESAEAVKHKKKTEYVITVIGSKIVINAGSRESLGAALDKFLNEVIVDKSGKISKTLNISGDYNADSYFEVLEGIRLTAIGDSYFGGSQLGKDGVWLKFLADEYDMKLRNYGIGGSTMSDYVTDRNPMCIRYKQMAKGADVVILEGGRNDFVQKVPLGTVDSLDSKTFAGSINVMINGLREMYPEAMLMCVTSWYVNESQQKYNQMMMDICEKQGVLCFNASDQELTGVYMDDSEFRKKYSQSATDVSHLNVAGMELVEPAFEKFIGEEYTKFLKSKAQS